MSQQIEKSEAKLWHRQGWGYTELGWDHWFPSVSSGGPPLPGGWTRAPRDTMQQFWLDVQFTARALPPVPMGEHEFPMGSSWKHLSVSQLLGGCSIGGEVSVLDDGKPKSQPASCIPTTAALDGKCWYLASSGILVGPSFFLCCRPGCFKMWYLVLYRLIHGVTYEGYGVLRWLECQAWTGLWQCVRFPNLKLNCIFAILHNPPPHVPGTWSLPSWGRGWVSSTKRSPMQWNFRSNSGVKWRGGRLWKRLFPNRRKKNRCHSADFRSVKNIWHGWGQVIGWSKGIKWGSFR